MGPRQFGQPYTVGAGSREQGFGSLYRRFPSSIKGLSRGSQCFLVAVGGSDLEGWTPGEKFLGNCK